MEHITLTTQHLAIIGSGNGLASVQHQAIVWTYSALLLTEHLQTSVKFE